MGSIGVVIPPGAVGQGVNALVPGTPIQTSRPVLLGKDPVWLHSDTPLIDLVVRAAGKPSLALPKPKYDTVDRPGALGLVRYRGDDPRDLVLPILIERGGRSIRPEIRLLEQLATRTEETLEPPIIAVQGAGVRHTGMRWRMTLPDEPTQVLYNAAGDPTSVTIAVTLIQHVADRVLAQTLTGGKGLRGRRTVTTREGETLYDVARREYGDPSRASDIQKANPKTRFGQVFHAGRRLRLP